MRLSGYVRTIIFGITDSLVSTVGLLAGIDLAGSDTHTIILTGFIYALVEAFSMAVGNYLSEESAEEYDAGRPVRGAGALIAAVLMFGVFVLAAFIPLAPYLVLTGGQALLASIGLAILALFVAGAISGAVARLPIFARGARMALLGGAAILIGAVVGLFFKP